MQTECLLQHLKTITHPALLGDDNWDYNCVFPRVARRTNNFESKDNMIVIRIPENDSIACAPKW